MTETFVFPSKTKNIAFALISIGLLGTVLGLTMGHDHNRVWANLLLNSYYFIGLALAGVFLAAAHQLGYGGWHVQIKRVFESTGSLIPVIGIIVALILLGGKMHWHHVYHWMDASLYDPTSPNYDEIMVGKSGFLNFGFFAARIIFYLSIWTFFAWLLRKISIKEDENGGLKYYTRNKFYAALFLIVYAVTSSTASWDFIMSVDPHWYSTLFGWYNFASCSVAGVAAITLVVLYLKKNGYLHQVNEEHYHNLGMFMFGFSVFWAYLWFSQYMLIWYANIPEETVYFYTRLHGKPLFKFLFYLNLFMNFIFPFLFLMTRTAKRNPAKLAFAAVVILCGHWVDYYLMVMPGSTGENAGIGLTEISITLGFVGLYVFVVLNTLTKASLVPVNNPFGKESMVHHTLK
ncbi:MAG: quinol:cytochrome C oxidoreductase [Chitinophagales bacterium]|nr:quinol:cytochrome C oxidoreductase [Chitinophagales bacterium]